MKKLGNLCFILFCTLFFTSAMFAKNKGPNIIMILIDDQDIAEQVLEAIDDDGWLKIHMFDKEYFLEVANEIYKSLSTAQKLSLLGETISTEQDYGDAEIAEMMLAPIDDQDGSRA